MARPAKPVDTKTGAMTKDEVQFRSDVEKVLKGDSDRINKASMKLTKNQKKIRKLLLKELEKVLSNVDCYILDQCCIAIDRLQYIEDLVNENPEKMFRKDIISAKKQYLSEFVRCCSELSMSPQARAKISSSLLPKKEKENNPLRALLDDDE